MKLFNFLRNLVAITLIAIQSHYVNSQPVELLVRHVILEWKLSNVGYPYLDIYVDFFEPNLTIHSVLFQMSKKPVLDDFNEVIFS